MKLASHTQAPRPRRRMAAVLAASLATVAAAGALYLSFRPAGGHRTTRHATPVTRGCERTLAPFDALKTRYPNGQHLSPADLATVNEVISAAPQACGMTAFLAWENATLGPWMSGGTTPSATVSTVPPGANHP